MRSDYFIDLRCKINSNRMIIDVEYKQNFSIKDNIQWEVEIVTRTKLQRVQLAHFKLSVIRHYEIELKESGNYLVFMFVVKDGRRYQHTRSSYWYYNKADIHDYKNFLKKKYHVNNHVPLALLNKPNQLLTLVKVKKSKLVHKLVDLFKSHFPNLLVDGTMLKNCILISQQLPVAMSNGQKIFYSGTSKYKGKYICGNDDLSVSMETDVLLKEIGNWSAIVVDGDSAKFTNDYFGMSPIYKYESSEISIVSNSFHLLLLIAKYAKCKLNLNVNNIIPYFVIGTSINFDQLISRNTFVKGVDKIAVYESIEIRKNELKILQKDYVQTFNKIYDCDEKIINEKLNLACEEIKQNLEMILLDNRFDRIICDVTGGKDSRTVLAALLNSKYSNDDRLLVNSLNTGKDKDVFIPLNHLHNIPYRDESVKYKLIRRSESDLIGRSILMGQSFKQSLPVSTYIVRDSNIIQLAGSGGEAILRAFVHYDYMDMSSLENLAESLLEAWNNGAVNINKIRANVKKLLMDEINDSLGITLFEKLQFTNLAYRNVFHFGHHLTFLKQLQGYEYFAPLYSKTLLELWHMTINYFKNSTLQFMVIDRLYPQLLKFPFVSDSDNKEFNKLLTNHAVKLNCTKIESIKEINNDDTAWKDAAINFASNKIIIKGSDDIYINEDNEQFAMDFKENIFKRLNQFVKIDKRFSKLIGLELFIMFKSNSSKLNFGSIPAELICLNNKITTVLDIYDLINN